MSKKLNEFFWHDGNLANITYSINRRGRAKLIIEASFYKDNDAPKRETYKITCNNVSRHNITLDTKELAENMFAGNISNGYVKDNTLWLYFSDGLIQIAAERFSIVKC
jgi:hypothetical protein